MTTRRIIERSGGVFWFTSFMNAVAATLGVTLLLTHAGHGPSDFARTIVPLIVVVPLTTAIASTPLLAKRVRFLARGQPLIDGVAAAWRAARHPSWRLAGAVGYLGLDMCVLTCMLRALGDPVDAGALILGYLLGYCGALIPIPGGLGVLEGGLVGALVVYGVPASQAAAAVLIYHAIVFWIPSLGGLTAYAMLQAQDRKAATAVGPEHDPRQVCGPGILSGGAATRPSPAQPRPAERSLPT
jgi:uncharacterized membrane protein YbhN (UPF0104 family)